MGTQRLGPTPKGKNQAWQFIRRKGASEEELKTQREKDSQSVKKARKRAKKEQARGYAARQPLIQRAVDAGITSSKGRLFTGPNYEEGACRSLAQKNFSQKVSRADKSASEQESANVERRSLRNFQQARDEHEGQGDRKKIVDYLTAAAQDGHLEAMGQLGDAYRGEPINAQSFRAEQENGDVLELDIGEKLELFWLQKAAEGGLGSAQYLLALAYKDGALGLDVDEDLAFLWLQKATEGGHGKAQYFLGWAYEDGDLGLDVNL